MGVNLVTRVRGFSIQNKVFIASDHDVQDGCVTPGNHRLLRFDFLSYNAGSADLVVGSPAARPDLFVWSAGHGHYHLKDFNEFQLFTSTGVLATAGGIVFAGAIDRGLSAYDDATGKELWRTRLNDVPSSAPITYLVNGRQYVALVTGNGGAQAATFPALVPEIKNPPDHGATLWVFELPKR